MIEFRHVHKHFGALHVLNDIDLRIEAGEVVVICGPSGSGKSTLLRCINRLEQIDSGEIVVDGISVATTREIARLRAEVGMVFQRFNLYPHLVGAGQPDAGAAEGTRCREGEGCIDERWNC